jgi:hypothetical protein
MKKLIKRIFRGKHYKNGESYVDTIVKVIICVVVGALLLTSVYAVAKSGLESAKNKVNDLLDYNPDGEDGPGGGDISVPGGGDEPEPEEPMKPYLTFQSLNPFTISVGSPKWDGTMEYSTDTYNWATWNGSSISSVDGKVYLRGTGNTGVSANSTGQYSQFLITGTAVECVGNIETLLDWQTVLNGEHPIMNEFCFAYAFYNCSSLITSPALPATTLANSCYHSMFLGCTNLTTAPALPATTLAEYCYRSMFEGCTSLTTAPALPATTLANSCYHSMFRGCTNLTTAPALPATTLANSCYIYMFYGCTSLTTAPVLPATTLASGCYGSMFNGCTSLTTAPSLPATTLANGCYSGMFSGCTSLTTAPELPATTLAGACYSSMFYGCTSLTTAPALPATTLEGACYSSMFDGCTALTTAPSLPATTLANNCYRYMFYDCTNLKISTTQSGAYQYEWRIPTEGTISSTPSGWNTDMFYNTGGTFTSNPTINTTYYLEYPPVGSEPAIPPVLEDLTGTKWQLKSTLNDYSLSMDEYFSLTGIATTDSYTIYFGWLFEGGVTVSFEDEWHDNISLFYSRYYNKWYYKTSSGENEVTAPQIEITGGAAATNTDVIYWLQQNATKIS